MATIRKNLYLYLSLACFLGIIAIFIVDGYLGIYDTIYITAGEREEKIEPDFWLQRDIPYYSFGVNEGEKIFLSYEISNRLFSSYAADIEASVWHSQEKIYELPSQHLQIDAFDKGLVDWIVDSNEFLSDDISSEQVYEFTVTIKRGQLERSIIVYLSKLPYLNEVKTVPGR